MPIIPAITSVDDAKKLVAERGLSHVKIALTDIDGVMRGKWLSKEKFFSVLDNGLGFCNILFGWDCGDFNYDNGIYANWDGGFPDAKVVIDPRTACYLPHDILGGIFGGGDNPSDHDKKDSLLFLAEGGEEKLKEIDPRSVLKKIIKKGESMGLFATAAVEYEFTLFKETPDSVRQKNYQNLDPLSQGFFGYSILRSGAIDGFYQQLFDMCQKIGMPIEGAHGETGPGAVEAVPTKADILTAADRAVIFKTFTKLLAQKNKLLACFMARWSRNYPGQSGHLHLSLTDKNGQSVFFDKGKDNNISETMLHFIGGQELLMGELLPMVAPTINSYTRLVPGYWAPIYRSWGIENRTCALRVIGDSEKSLRVEYRIAAADQNPYLALAVALASGLYGIEHKIKPHAPIVGNCYENKEAKKRTLASNLGGATETFRQSSKARELFGDFFVDHFANSRDWEQRESDKAITDWQLQRYFEII